MPDIDGIFVYFLFCFAFSLFFLVALGSQYTQLTYCILLVLVFYHFK